MERAKKAAQAAKKKAADKINTTSNKAVNGSKKTGNPVQKAAQSKSNPKGSSAGGGGGKSSGGGKGGGKSGGAPTYRSDGDPMRELGAGRDTHPDEWDAHIQRAESLGVEVSHNAGGIAYAPGLRQGSPGQLIIDPDASISALRHEMSHLDDDLAVGWGGFQKAYDRDFMWASEFKAYNVEISFARSLGRFDLARQLIGLARAWKADVYAP